METGLRLVLALPVVLLPGVFAWRRGAQLVARKEQATFPQELGDHRGMLVGVTMGFLILAAFFKLFWAMPLVLLSVLAHSAKVVPGLQYATAEPWPGGL